MDCRICDGARQRELRLTRPIRSRPTFDNPKMLHRREIVQPQAEVDYPVNPSSLIFPQLRYGLPPPSPDHNFRSQIVLDLEAQLRVLNAHA
jgi:hypothetical protein